MCSKKINSTALLTTSFQDDIIIVSLYQKIKILVFKGYVISYKVHREKQISALWGKFSRGSQFYSYWIKEFTFNLNSDLPDPLFRIRPDPDLFFKLISGRIRIQSKNGRIQPDPELDLGSGRSLFISYFLYFIKSI